MLRITQTIELKLRKNESRFSRDFLKGLVLALTFHALLFLLFRIVSLPNLETIRPLAPIAVETDLHTSEVEVLPVVKTTLYPLETLITYFDQLQELAVPQLKNEFFYVKKNRIEDPDFSEVERIDYTPLSNILEEEND